MSICPKSNLDDLNATSEYARSSKVQGYGVSTLRNVWAPLAFCLTLEATMPNIAT